MIKNYENFINEGFKGFLDSTLTGLESETHRTVINGSIRTKAEKILTSGNENVNKEKDPYILMRKLITLSSLFVDEQSGENNKEKIKYYISILDKIDEVTSRIKELMESGEYNFDYDNGEEDYEDEEEYNEWVNDPELKGKHHRYKYDKK
jgi:hypothetical protein